MFAKGIIDVSIFNESYVFVLGKYLLNNTATINLSFILYTVFRITETKNLGNKLVINCLQRLIFVYSLTLFATGNYRIFSSPILNLFYERYPAKF